MLEQFLRRASSVQISHRDQNEEEEKYVFTESDEETKDYLTTIEEIKNESSNMEALTGENSHVTSYIIEDHNY